MRGNEAEGLFTRIQLLLEVLQLVVLQLLHLALMLLHPLPLLLLLLLLLLLQLMGRGTCGFIMSLWRLTKLCL